MWILATADRNTKAKGHEICQHFLSVFLHGHTSFATCFVRSCPLKHAGLTARWADTAPKTIRYSLVVNMTEWAWGSTAKHDQQCMHLCNRASTNTEIVTTHTYAMNWFIFETDSHTQFQYVISVRLWAWNLSVRKHGFADAKRKKLYVDFSI